MVSWLLAQFKRRTCHVPNLIPLVKYMKRSTFESVKSNICNLGWLMSQDQVAHMRILAMEQLHVKRQTSHVPNPMYKLLNKIYFLL